MKQVALRPLGCKGSTASVDRSARVWEAATGCYCASSRGAAPALALAASLPRWISLRASGT
jgi:hypothetical protein